MDLSVIMFCFLVITGTRRTICRGGNFWVVASVKGLAKEPIWPWLAAWKQRTNQEPNYRSDPTPDLAKTQKFTTQGYYSYDDATNSEPDTSDPEPDVTLPEPLHNLSQPVFYQNSSNHTLTANSYSLLASNVTRCLLIIELLILSYILHLFILSLIIPSLWTYCILLMKSETRTTNMTTAMNFLSHSHLVPSVFVWCGFLCFVAIFAFPYFWICLTYFSHSSLYAFITPVCVCRIYSLIRRVFPVSFCWSKSTSLFFFISSISVRTVYCLG